MDVIMMGRKRTRRPGIDRLPGAFALGALGRQGEVDHHDGVFLDDPHQHDHPHKGVDVQIHAEEHQGQQGPDPGGGQPREDGQGVDEAFVEDAQDQIDDQDGHDQQEPQALHGRLEGLGCPLKVGGNAGRQHLPGHVIHRGHRVAQGHARLEVEGDGHRRQLARVVDGQGSQVPGREATTSRGTNWSLLERI